MISREKYEEGKFRKFGKSNPEIMNVDFWKAMIQSGVPAWTARQQFGDEGEGEPVWCFSRFGKTITALPDGRFVEIAGEHEDSYDPDFCIYNDVTLHEGDGKVTVFGYPKEIFPPTDFHSATLVEDCIFIIGSLGYSGDRISKKTPVYRLNCSIFAIEEIQTSGENPGWISHHRARYERDSIYITSGKVWTAEGSTEQYTDNSATYRLNLVTMRWTIEGS